MHRAIGMQVIRDHQFGRLCVLFSGRLECLDPSSTVHRLKAQKPMRLGARLA
jgi:hypothetical protein